MLGKLKSLFRQKDKPKEASPTPCPLSLRRDRLYALLGNLQDQEEMLFNRGKETSSTTIQRRMASLLAQKRTEIRRINNEITALSHQINIKAADNHNLLLLELNKMAALPPAEILIDHATQAEQICEEVMADSELVNSFVSTQTQVSAEELEILKEFEQASSPTPQPAPNISQNDPETQDVLHKEPEQPLPNEPLHDELFKNWLMERNAKRAKA